MGVFDFLGGGVVGAVGEALDAVTTSDEERLKAETELLKQKQTPDLAQMEVNKQEAAHPSVFVAGWRPAIGWVCAIGLGYHFLFYPVVSPFVWEWLGVSLLDLEVEGLMTLVMGMLGLGGLRTFEKMKGVARARIAKEKDDA